MTRATKPRPPTTSSTRRNILIGVALAAVTLACVVTCVRSPDGISTGSPATPAVRTPIVTPTTAPLVPAAPTVTSDWTFPRDPSGRHIVVVGDSYTGGSGYGGIGPTNWNAIVWGDLTKSGIAVDPQVSGQGGSGYVRRGTAGTVFGEEAARLVTPDDELVVFFGGLNDGEEPLGTVAAAAKADFEHVRAVAPNATLMVIGPMRPHTAAGQIAPLRDAIRDAALATNAVFVDPVADGWFADSPPSYVGADGVHPTDAGHAYLASLIEPHIRDALASLPSG